MCLGFRDTRPKAARVAPPEEDVKEGQLVVLLLVNRERESWKQIGEDSKEVILLLPVEAEKNNQMHETRI